MKLGYVIYSIKGTELGIPNYRLIRLDRNQHGGGVLMYAQASLVTDVLVKGTPANCPGTSGTVPDLLLLTPVLHARCYLP